jgi:hypothetical protein
VYFYYIDGLETMWSIPSAPVGLLVLSTSIGSTLGQDPAAPLFQGTSSNQTKETKPFSDPRTVARKDEIPTLFTIQESIATADQSKSRRKFISYTSSYIERLWMEHVDHWADEKSICDALLDQQSSLIHDLLELSCTARYMPPYQHWCVIDDFHHPLWYNTADRDRFELSWVSPLPKEVVLGEPQPVVPTKKNEHVVSKFVFLDETTGEEYVEYIEPLVSHLRFALCKCITPKPNNEDYKHHLTMFRGWIIPPPPEIKREKTYYFDVGASTWNAQRWGGPSLQFFANVWKRQSIDFDDIYAFDRDASVHDFYREVPAVYQPHVHYQQCAVSGKPQDGSDDHPFIPNLARRTAQPGDYVLFKIDIDDPKTELEIINYILDDSQSCITELVWEHHISGNYLMSEWGKMEDRDQSTLRQSYDLFVRLRRKGIRAHSWV